MRPEVLPGTYEKGTAPVPPGSCGALRFVSGQALSEEAPSHHYRTSDKSIPHTSQTEPTSTQRPTSSFAASEAASCDHNDDFCNVACLVLLVCPFAFEPIFAPVLAPLIKGRSALASQVLCVQYFLLLQPSHTRHQAARAFSASSGYPFGSSTTSSSYSFLALFALL